MIFSLVTFTSAFLIEGLGTWISIVGLSSLFSADPIIIALAAALDIGKIVCVSFLYKRWSTAPKMLRLYMILATAVLMIITSAGAFGYLSAAFQGTIKDTMQQQVLVSASIEEKTKLEARKLEIDAQIAQLPSNIVQGRQKLITAFKGEADRINLRLRQLDAELPKMRAQQITINTHAGPIVYVSQAFNLSVEQAVKYVILVIIFVFDPLAIALLVAGNFLWESRTKKPGVPVDASAPHVKAIEPLQAPLNHPGVMAPDGARNERGDPVGALIVSDEPAEGRAAMHAELERQPIHLVASQNRSEPSGVKAPESISRVDTEPSGVSRGMAPASSEQTPRIDDPEQAIRETAYYLAEKRAFKDGAPTDDWVRAEKAIVKDGRTVS